MNIYVVYDKQTGRIVHTTAKYVLGNDQPVACEDDEVLAIARREAGAGADLAVTKLPDDFNISDRTRGIEIDLKTGLCRAVVLERRSAGTDRQRRPMASAVDEGNKKARSSPPTVGRAR